MQHNFYKYPNVYQPYYDERFGGVLIPLLLGGLGGAAIVSASRPRPVYVNPPMQVVPYQPNYPAGSYSSYYNSYVGY